MDEAIELAARLVNRNFVRLQHGSDADSWQYTMSAHDIVSAFSECRDAEIDRLREECARLRADAERYRWLRGFDVDSYLACGKGAALDAAIDAAMAPKEAA